MAFSDKLSMLDTMLTEHYARLNLGDRRQDILGVISKLKEMGVTDATLSDLTPEDLESIGVPRMLARRFVKMVGGSSTDGSKNVVIIDDNPVNLAARLKPEELIEQYDPLDPTSPYGVRLKQISNGVKFFAYNSDGTVSIPLSQRFLREILDGYPARKTAIVNGKPQELYAVGERPARYADENPVVIGTMLRPDGMSDTHVHWGSIPLEVRQLIYIATKECKLGWDEVTYYEYVHGKSFNDVAKRMPEAAVKFEKLKGTESLPSLKIELTPRLVTPPQPK